MLKGILSPKPLPNLNLSATIERAVRDRPKDLFTEEEIRASENFYRQFLKASGTNNNPDIEFIPSKAVDIIWHAHILDTRNYASDCAREFGKFVHHNPSNVGESPEDAVRTGKAIIKETDFGFVLKHIK